MADSNTNTKYLVKWVIPSTGERGTLSFVFSSYEDAERVIKAQRDIEIDWTIECVST